MSWSNVIGNRQAEAFLQGYGNPQGNVVAELNRIYVDLAGPSFYRKSTPSGAAGWVAFVQGSIGATAPDAPTSPVGTRGNAQVSVAFTPGADNGSAITSYTVTSSPGGLTGTGASSPVVVTGLTNGTAYTFTVKATNGVGESAASAASSSVTPCTVPTAPLNATASNPGATTMDVTFDTPASNGGATITTFTVTSSPGGITGTRSAATGGTVTMTGLTASTSYTFTVTATNADGVGPASTPTSALSTLSAGTNDERYWGASATTQLNEAGILALTMDDTVPSHDATFTVNLADQYLYYAFPTRYGLITSVVTTGNPTNQINAYTGANGTFTSPLTIEITPSGGVAEDYYLYRSNNLLFGNVERTFSSP